MRMRPFTDTLRDLRNGKTLDDLSHQLAALVMAVEDTQRAGEIKLTLKIKPSAKGPWVHIEDKIDVKMPEPDREATLFWPVDGELRRQDPRQSTFDLKAANTTPPEDAGDDEEEARA